jgi:hypothetical protein
MLSAVIRSVVSYPAMLLVNNRNTSATSFPVLSY